MTRPAYLVIDPEYPGNISSRKLVLETAKLNVITAYSGPEAVETLSRFPNMDAVVMNGQMPRCAEIAKQLKDESPKVPLVIVSPNASNLCDFGDHNVSSYEPQALLDFLRQLARPTL